MRKFIVSCKESCEDYNEKPCGTCSGSREFGKGDEVQVYIGPLQKEYHKHFPLWMKRRLPNDRLTRGTFYKGIITRVYGKSSALVKFGNKKEPIKIDPSIVVF